MNLRRIVLAGGLVATGVLAPAAPAAATIGTCSVTEVGVRSGSAYCTGTPPSTFRVVLICADSFAKYGQWRDAGGGVPSVASCPIDALPTYTGVAVRNP